jgi:hypothetical protein
MLNALWKASAENLFREYVLNPLPESVARIKVDKPMSKRRSYCYVFRFNIEWKDFESIRDSRSFRKAVIISYMGGEGLSWDWEDWDSTKTDEIRGVSFSMYDFVGKPYWYDLPTWENPEAYALTKEDSINKIDYQVLLYNSKLGQAYFITYHYGGGLFL